MILVDEAIAPTCGRKVLDTLTNRVDGAAIEESLKELSDIDIYLPS
jgi:hypothetical protein